MRDKKLPLLAKTIHVYFCGYAGNDRKAFPKRKKTVKDLQMNKDTFTKHLNILVADGYIIKEREKSGNIYMIMQTVHTYGNNQGIRDETMTNMLVMENIAAKGCGVHHPHCLCLYTILQY